MTALHLDTLIERLNEYVKQWEDFDHGTWPECRAMREAAAALAELREDNARLRHPTAMDEAIAAGDGTLHGAIDHWQQRSARAEAELDTQNRALAQCRALLKQECDDVVPLRDKVAAIEAEREGLAVEFRRVEVLWKEAAIDASRKHDTISGLENACRISLYRADALQAENRLLRECARTPDLERIDAAIDAARAKEK